MKKKTLIITMLLCLIGVASACNDNSNEPTLQNGESLVGTKLTVKVENAADYNSIVEVKLMVYDVNLDWDVELARGDWKDGGFTIELPETLEPNNLYAIINNSGQPTTIIDIPTTLTISNKNAKIGNAHFWGIDKDGKVVTHFHPFKIDEFGNAKTAVLTYVDSDITVSGHNKGWVIISEFDEDKNANFGYEYEKTTSYLIKWRKGWNVWYLSKSRLVTEKTMTEQWANTCFCKLKWYSNEDLGGLNINE